MDILRSFTPLVEPIASDEAFLDVGGAAPHPRLGPGVRGRDPRGACATRPGSPRRWASRSTKLLAKLASDLAKPDGLLVVAPGNRARVPPPAPGRAALGRRARDAQAARRARRRDGGRARGVARARARVGGRWRARAAPPRAGLEPRRPTGRTVAGREVDRPRRDVPDRHPRPRERWSTWSSGWPTASRRGCAPRAGRGRTVQLKVRYAGFRTITRSRTLREPTDLAADIAAVAGALLRDVPDLEVGIRLIGVSMQQLSVPAPQPRLFGEPDLFGPGGSARDRRRSRAWPRRFRRAPSGRLWSVRSTPCGHGSARMRWDPAPHALSRHRPCARMGMRSG